MKIKRRSFLTNIGMGAVGAFAARAAKADPTANSKLITPDLRGKLAARAMENRIRLDFDGSTFSGPGWDFLIRQASAAQFFLLGEEHGVAQIPMLCKSLLLALKPSGYDRLALEISAPVAAELDRAALHGVEGIRQFNAEFPPGPAFYNMKEEAAFLAAVRPALPAKFSGASITK